VGTGFDIALLDPPREGARPAVMELVTAAIPCVIYVSCDPATLARDAGILARGGYRLVSFKGFDMFPQTHHIETLACFRLER
jgi:23S rRNA (uracil1939-C5)-methyltransferase